MVAQDTLDCWRRACTRDAASNWICDQQNHLKQWEHTLEQKSNNLFSHRGNRTPGMTHGDDFVVTAPTFELVELKNKVAGVCSITTKLYQPRFDRRHQRVEQKGALVRTLG